MTGLGIVAFAMGAAGFVDATLSLFDRIEKKRLDTKQTKELMENLQLFGMHEVREDLQISLVSAQETIKDRSTPPERKKRLARSYKSLADILEDIPDCMDEVIEHANKKITFSSKPEKKLRTKVGSFDQAMRNFQEDVLSMRKVTMSNSTLLLTLQRF